MKNIQKGFTLVELIVVITILAILGTIAFISLQGYSQDARDSKVVSDIRSLSSVVETSLTEGSSVHTFVGTEIAGNQVSGVQDGSWTFGSGVTMSGSTYTVGGIDFIALGQSATDFTDNGTDIYKIGTFSNSVLGESYVMYQIAGLQGGADSQTAIVKGNYIFTGTDQTGLVSDLTNTTGLQDGANVATGIDL